MTALILAAVMAGLAWFASWAKRHATTYTTPSIEETP